jgi:hypothetical protein
MGLASDKVRAGQSFGYPILLNIPALVPQFNIPNCLFTSYELQLSVGFARNSPNAVVLNLNVSNLMLKISIKNLIFRFPLKLAHN